MRQKFLQYVQKLYMEITAVLEGFYLYKIISEYAKNIIACMENKLK